MTRFPRVSFFLCAEIEINDSGPHPPRFLGVKTVTQASEEVSEHVAKTVKQEAVPKIQALKDQGKEASTLLCIPPRLFSH